MEAQRRGTEPKPSDMMSGLSHGSHTKGGWKDVLGTENSIERSNGLVLLKTKVGSSQKQGEAENELRKTSRD